MNVDTSSLFTLPAAETLEIIEREASRRRDEMLADPNLGNTHEETWGRVVNRRG